MLRYTEREVWKMTPYKILRLYEYHKEYNPQNTASTMPSQQRKYESMDDIDVALGGL